MMHEIFGFIDSRTRRVFHVGCRNLTEGKAAKLPSVVEKRCAELGNKQEIVILQTVESAPLLAWVKWSKRFRRDILTNDWQQFRSQADALTNSNRLKRALGEEVPGEAVYQEKFHEFDRRNPEVFEEILRTARRLKTEGRRLFGMDAIISELRWDGPNTKQTDRFKINDSHRAFYARKLQMIDPALCGLFAMRESLADDLVLEDGRTWRDFANEHHAELHFAAPADADEEDTDWTY
jgi:hypothetical protein